MASDSGIDEWLHNSSHRGMHDVEPVIFELESLCSEKVDGDTRYKGQLMNDLWVKDSALSSANASECLWQFHTSIV